MNRVRRLLSRLLLVAVCAVLLLAAPAARAAAANDVFLGYSRTGSDTFYPHTGGLNGIEGSVFIHFKPFIGAEGDVAHYGLGASAGVPHTTTFMIGPRVIFGAAGFRLMAHGLIGGEHSANNDGGVLPISATSYAYVLGVGVDVPLVPFFAWRIQADRISAPSVSPASGTHARFGTGLVFRF